MKSWRTIFVSLLLLALIGGLAWEFWPMDNSAPTANPSPAKPATPKIANAPKLTPIHVAVVEAPKIAPAPAHDASEPLTPPVATRGPRGAPPPPPPPGVLVGSPSDPNDVNDFGEVYFSSGVPQQLTMNDGTPVTVTATLGVNGDVQLRVEITQTSPNGGTSHMTMITGTQQGRTMTLGGPRGMSRIKITPRVN